MENTNSLNDLANDILNNQNKVINKSDSFTNIEKVDKINREETVRIPSIDLESLKNFFELVVSDVFKKEIKEFFKDKDNKEISEKSITQYKEAKLAGDLDLYTPDSVFTKRINEGFSNIVEADGHDLNSKKVVYKDNGVKQLSGIEAIKAFKRTMSLGDVVAIPLWHSGFWITIEPPTQMEILNLQYTIAKAEITIGLETGALIYTHYMGFLAKFIIDMIKRKMVSCSLSIGKKEDIFKYISLNDLYILTNGLCASLFPDGVDVHKECLNNYTLDENKKPKCNFKFTGKVDINKLLWVDKSCLDIDMLNQMKKKEHGSVTIDEVLEYQSKLEGSKEKTIKLKTLENIDYNVTLKIPSIRDYVNASEAWIEDLKKELESLGTKEDKNEAIHKIALLRVLGAYTSLITKIEFGEYSTTDKNTFSEILAYTSLTKLSNDEFLTEIRHYIELTPIAIIGTENFECPECKNKYNNENEKFKEIIPLNILTYFLGLGAFYMRNIKA